MSNKLKPIADFFGDLISIPILIVTGPVIGNPIGTKILAFKVVKVVFTLTVALIIAIVCFSSLAQQNDSLSSRILSKETDSYLADYNAGKNKTYFSEQLYNFINKYDGKLVTDPNGYFNGECVSLVKQWQNHISVPFLYWEGNYPKPAFEAFVAGNYSLATPTNKYSLTTIFPKNVSTLEAGDLVILTGFPSHTAIATGRIAGGKYELFEQNAPNLMSPPNLSFYNNSTFIGAIRYKPKN